MSEQYARFQSDTAKHEMRVLREDGVYRHLRCQQPGTYCMAFDVITWPGHLCYTGDMGTFVFSRLPDMFQFFRGDEDGRIDRRYWAEKCFAADRDGIREYREALFQEAVAGRVAEFIENEGLTDDEAADLRQCVEDEVLCSGDNHQDAVAAAMAFRWAPNSATLGREVFSDFWEHRLEDYTGRFTWCCFALRWAIARYDAQKGEAQPCT